MKPLIVTIGGVDRLPDGTIECYNWQMYTKPEFFGKTEGWTKEELAAIAKVYDLWGEEAARKIITQLAKGGSHARNVDEGEVRERQAQGQVPGRPEVGPSWLQEEAQDG